MKLELKHLAAYLPYGLKLQNTYNDNVDVLRSIVDGPDYDDVKIKIGYADAEHIWMFKPVLRPVSDLFNSDYEPLYDQAIYRFVRSASNTCDAYDEWVNALTDYFVPSAVYDKLQQAPFEVIQDMLSEHFDVFGLIPAGLAIDINTL